MATFGNNTVNRGASAFRSATTLVVGENGAMKVGMDHAGWKPMLASTDAVRKGGPKQLPEVRANGMKWIVELKAEIRRTNNPKMAAHTIKAAVAKRDPRDGEGEKLISFCWLLELYREFPTTIITLVREHNLIGVHGCWGDIQKIMIEIYAMSDVANLRPEEQIHTWGDLVDAMRDSILSQRRSDVRELDRFLKAVGPMSVDETWRHWSRGGVRAYETLDQCLLDGKWVLPNEMDEHKANILKKNPNASNMSQSKLGQNPRWRAMQKIVEYCSTKEYLEAHRVRTGVEEKPLTISWAGKWIGREGSKAGKSLGDGSTGLWWWVRGNYPGKPQSLRKDKFYNYYLRSELKSRDATGVDVPFSGEMSIPYGAKRQFRIRTAALNAVLDVPQVKMCADLWHMINFNRVPSIALTRGSSAYLNEKPKEAPTSTQEATGNRHPDSYSRVKCRENLRAFTTTPEKAAKLNAGANFPHHVAFAAKNATSTAKRDLARAQWHSMKTEIKAKLDVSRAKLAEEAAAAGKMDDVQRALASGNFLPCVDVSESMTWDGSEPERPIDVATACGAVMSQVSNVHWEGLLVSFTDDPRIFDTKGKDVDDVIREIYQNKGYNTNFYKMMMAVCEHMVKNNVPDGEEPVLVVFTDGEWDTQDRENRSSGWETMHKTIVREYAHRGRKRVPTIVYWNLKPGRNGVQTMDHHPGVVFLQGQSPNLFKYILYAESLPDTEQTVVVDGQKTTVKSSSATPYDTFCKAMASEYLDDVERVLVASTEGVLARYHGMEA